MSKIVLDHQEIEVVFHHKKTKHSYVRVKAPGIIHVTVGRYATKKRMEKYILEHRCAILRNVKKFQEAPAYQVFGEHVEQVLTNRKDALYDEVNKILYLPMVEPNKHVKEFEKQLLLKTVDEMLAVFPHQDFIDISGLKISTRYTTTVHGSCHAKKRRINLNLYLVRREKRFLHYVLMHEIAHLKVQNHSKEFYQVLRVICPDYQAIKSAMKRT